MKTAIIGFAGSGKTSLYAALAGNAAAQSDRAMIKVPEPRLDPLIRLFTPKKVTLTEIEVQDTKGASSKGGLGEKILTEIRPFDCLLAVLDGFSGLHDPEGQRREIEADLIISDLSVIEKRLERVASDKKKAKALVDPREEECLLRAREVLESDRPLRADQDLAAAPELKGFRFLSAKPVLYAWNLDEQGFADRTMPEDGPGEVHVTVSARLERDLAEITDPEERKMFLGDLGVSGSALERIISRLYDLLGLVTFLTAGEKEVRSWPLKRGLTAPEAAGVIHSDIQKGFIRAEVLAYADLLACKDFKTAKERGLLRLEGKEYVVKDGDIITFRFNV
jgi:ribosome-binding ATPase